MVMRSNRFALTGIPVVLLSVASQQAGATWSIVAVDPITREVGAAAATCSLGVEIIFGAVPGRGVIVAQAATNFSARRKGVAMFASGAGPREVISLLANEEFNHGSLWSAAWREQQYGVAEGTVSVQGNMLYSREVVHEAIKVSAPLAARVNG